MNYSIYILIDPRTEMVRYVGITSRSLDVRLRQHLKRARSGDRDHRSCWIRQLLSVDLQPVIELVEITLDKDRERYWISAYRDLGCDLTNSTVGGDGLICPTDEVRDKIRKTVTGSKHSEEARRKISEASKEHWKNPEYRQRVVEGHIGQKRTMETCARISAGLKGKRNRAGQQNSSEHNARISAALKGHPSLRVGHPHTEESKQKISQAKMGNKAFLGHTHSEETKEKLRNAMFGNNKGKRRVEDDGKN